MAQTAFDNQPDRPGGPHSELEAMIRKAAQAALAEGETQTANDLADILRDFPLS